MRLSEQVRFLARSGQHYDAGDWSEAQRMAVAVRILVHDQGQSRSLLAQLDVKQRLRMHDASLHPDVVQADAGRMLQEIIAARPDLVGFEIVWRPRTGGLATLETISDGTVLWLPRGEQHPTNPDLGFEEWWTAKIIEAPIHGPFSRKQVVLFMANQDGGAHVDPEVDEEYGTVWNEITMQYAEGDYTTSEPEEWSLPAGNVIQASVRQIAYELLVTLDRELPGLVKSASTPGQTDDGPPSGERPGERKAETREPR